MGLFAYDYAAVVAVHICNEFASRRLRCILRLIVSSDFNVLHPIVLSGCMVLLSDGASVAATIRCVSRVALVH